MSKTLDTVALRAKLRVYDPSLPRCTRRIVRVTNHAPDYVSEEERGEWDMRLSYPCSDVEGHEGQCREGRAVLGWPGFATLTALLDEVERRRDVYDLMGAVEHSANTLAAHEDRGAWEERASVVAYLRANTCGCHDFAGDIERGEHLREEEP